MNWETRPHKQKCRHLAVSFPQKAAHSVIMLPSSNALCVREAILGGLITRDTKCMFAEQDPNTFEEMQLSLQQLSEETGFSNLTEGSFQGKLDQVTLPRLYDYAFFDFNGPLTQNFCEWMIDYFQLRMLNPHIAVTVHSAYRNCPFSKECAEFFNSRNMYPLTKYFETDNYVQAVYLHILLNLLGPQKFNVQFLQHHDTHKMFTFLMTATDNSETYELPHREEFVEFVLNGSAKMSTKSATKAWTTRRSQDKKRSNAAKKAWATRRQMAIDEKRSNAAKKAWTTRRANA